MKILVLAAMDKEVDLLLEHIDNVKEIERDNSRIWYGCISNNEVYLAKCGIGKVNSAINTTTLLRDLNPDLVINSGVAGGTGMPIGSLLIPDKVAYHDVWCGPGTNPGQADGMPLYFIPSSLVTDLINESNFSLPIERGLLCSGDKFISKSEEIVSIKSDFPEVKAVDMESASIAHACKKYGIPFAIIRVVSDTPGEGENIAQYNNFWETAPRKNFEVLKTLLERI
ncbi:MAG: 5'-methylthioadenosine/adenosylhomocysteine nucleosidase [Muribaculaceae bacterium]|nr:5'-methylthioadenosine/adenosylhomocysteine nucleosidase [Muribaculaceae bacterium]